MPALSNGYIGTVVNNESVYLNGFYNGREGRSHRVRVPAMNSIYAFFDSTDPNEIPMYTLDCRRGPPNAHLNNHFPHRHEMILVFQVST
jgi:hypothetical protein